MLLTILKATTGLALGLGISVAAAQSIRDAGQPAEIPPASYTGKQYVDSKGCVYVRAGFDGNVTWVPRSDRKRNVLCGFQPTFARNETPTPAPRVATAPTVAPTVTKPRPTAVAPVQTPPRQTVATTPARVATAPVRTAPVRTPPVRTLRVAAPRATTPAQLPRTPSPAATAGTSCPGMSPLSQKYMTSNTYKVRCGPQIGSPTYGAPTGTVGAPGPSGPTSGALHVAPAPKIAPPPGYRAAFDDGRFNPNRGLGTREGHAQMRLIWTSGVPRRLVDQNTGRDVTSLFPGLRFPFISFRQQKRYVAVNGYPSATAQPSYSVSTKNSPAPVAAAPSAVASGHRFVQVGTFAETANAQSSAARLKALGLPVRIGTYKKSGKTYRIVLAGPFGSASQLQAGLNAARRAGFGDAFTRK